MGSPANIPQTWIPYGNTKDCSQGFCSMNCPQWCYIIFPPPPPFDFQDEDSGPNFSPLVISIIGILASAFLLISYYAIISKYCRNRESTSRMQNLELEENQDGSIHGQWHVPTNGLDESLIKSITMFKYKKGDGLFEGNDCSVCLCEFQENESLRLLPKCSHAFHANCIDTWLKSHSNCPSCRANIVVVNGPPRELPPPAMGNPSGSDVLPQPHPIDRSNVTMLDDIELGVTTHSQVQLEGQRTGRCLYCNGGDSEEVEIRENSSWDGLTTSENGNTFNEIRLNEGQPVRRSLSMDNSCDRGRVSIADILCTSDDEDEQMQKCKFQKDVGTSKEVTGDLNNGLHSVTRPVAMKRSFSSGRFMFSSHGRGRNRLIPL